MKLRIPRPVRAADTLLGREVSCGVLQGVFAYAEEHEVNPSSLVAATGYPLSHYLDPTERVSWDAVRLVAERAADLWDEEQLRAVGAKSLDLQHFEAQVFLARLLVRPTEAYAFVIRGDTQGDFACLTARTEVDGQRVVIDVAIAQGYHHSPPLFSILAGAAEALPILFGLAPATVDVAIVERGARLTIDVPPGGGRWSLVDRIHRRFWGGRGFGQVADRMVLRTEALETEVAKRLAMEIELTAALGEHDRRMASLNDAVIEADDSGEITFCSPSLAPVLRMTEAEFMADPWEVLQPPEDDALPWLAWVPATERWIEVNPSRCDDRSSRLLVVRDVTDRIELAEQLSSAQRLESLGVMAAGVAHDFNNLLVPILTNAGSLRAELDDDSPLRERVETIEHAAHLASNLVEQILASTRHPAESDAVCDVAAVVRSIRPLLSELVPTGATLIIDAAGSAPARIDEESIDQLVTNLVLNAAQAIEPDGSVAVTVTVSVADDTTTVTVADDGVGMTPETAQRITDPFFTTKPDGRGLGLAALAGLVSAGAAVFDVDTAPGLGTKISVTFASADQLSIAEPPQELSEPESTGAHLLFVDDDELVRQTVELVLAPAPETVRTVASAAEALAILDGDDRVDVIVTDLTMPTIRGPELLRRARAVRPSLPGVLTTGAGMESASSELSAADLDDVTVMAKPFTPAELLAVVRRELRVSR